jgi:hypothetical protein
MTSSSAPEPDIEWPVWQLFSVGAIVAPMAINREWHESHRMPERATLDDRVAWHVEHATACGCRPMPRTVVDELARRDRVQQQQQQQ